MLSQPITMFCDICSKSGNLIHPCQCSLQCHESCIRLWHNDVNVGKLFRCENILCPKCDSIGNKKYMSIDDSVDLRQNIAMCSNITENKEWIYIWCRSCCRIKKHAMQSELIEINNKYVQFCHECCAKTYQKCPRCSVSVEKQSIIENGFINRGMSEILTKCNCGANFCWYCLKISDEDKLYWHIDNKHEYLLKYNEYYSDVENEHRCLKEIPIEFRSKELVESALSKYDLNLQDYENQTKESIFKTIKHNCMFLQFIDDALLNDEDYYEIVWCAVSKYNYVFKFVNQKRFNDINYKKIVLHVLKGTHRDMLQFIDNKRFNSDDYKEIASLAIKENSLALMYITSFRLDDATYKEIAIEAVTGHSYALHLINDERFDDMTYEEIVMKAIEADGAALRWVKDNRFDDTQYHEIVCATIASNPYAVEWVKDHRLEYDDYKLLAMALVFHFDDVLNLINHKRFTDEDYIEIISESISHHNSTFKYIESDRINHEKYFDMVSQAVANDPNTVQYVRKDTLSPYEYYEILKIAFKKNRNVLNFLHNDTENEVDDF